MLDAMAKDQHDYTDYYEKQEALLPTAFANCTNTATRHDSVIMKRAVTKEMLIKSFPSQKQPVFGCRWKNYSSIHQTATQNSPIMVSAAIIKYTTMQTTYRRQTYKYAQQSVFVD